MTLDRNRTLNLIRNMRNVRDQLALRAKSQERSGG